jgi:chromosome segregation ATPase
MANMTFVTAVIAAVISIASVGITIGKLQQSAKERAAKDKEQDEHIGKCANKEDVVNSIRHLEDKWQHEQDRREKLDEIVGQHSAILAGLQSTLNALNSNVQKLTDKIDNLVAPRLPS